MKIWVVSWGLHWEGYEIDSAWLSQSEAMLRQDALMEEKGKAHYSFCVEEIEVGKVKVPKVVSP